LSSRCTTSTSTVQIAVDDHVSESGHVAKLGSEITRKYLELGKLVDGARVVRNVTAGTRDQVGRHVENILYTQLETPLDDPPFLAIGFQFLEGMALVASQRLECLVQSKEVSTNDRGVELTRAHRPKSPAAIRAACTASILRR
jgi:hypothetical protein